MTNELLVLIFNVLYKTTIKTRSASTNFIKLITQISLSYSSPILGLEVDLVFFLSKEQKDQEEKEPDQNLLERIMLNIWNLDTDVTYEIKIKNHNQSFVIKWSLPWKIQVLFPPLSFCFQCQNRFIYLFQIQRVQICSRVLHIIKHVKLGKIRHSIWFKNDVW